MSKRYKHLLSPLRVGNHLFKNHIVMTPTTPSNIQGDERYPAESLIQHYAMRAKGGAALVTVTGAAAFLNEEAKPVTLRNDYEFDIEASNQHYLSMLTESIHMHGSFCTLSLQHMFDDKYDLAAGVPAFGAEGVNPEPRVTKPEIPVELIHKSTEDLIRRCKLIQSIGFDGVYLHMSYQFSLIARALSPLTNKRTDEYGGSFENRIRLLKETCQGIKEACGQDFIIEGHITGEERDTVTRELIPGGWTLDDSARLATEMNGLMDILHLRGWNIDGQHPIAIDPDYPPFLYMAEYVKQHSDTDVKILTVSGFHDPDIMEEAIAEGKTDLIGIARSLIADPDFIEKLYDDRADDIKPCIRCNKCLKVGWNVPQTTRCSVNGTWSFEHRLPGIVKPATTKKRVAVVGGGPAGMEVAHLARERGHEVDLFEKSDALGGQLRVGDHASHKWPLRELKDFLAHQCQKKGVNIHLNTEATPDMIDKGNYDAVVMALGSTPKMPEVEGVSNDNVYPALYAYGNADKLGNDVVIIGGGENGIETGMYLADDCNKHVTVLSRSEKLAKDAAPFHYRAQMEIAWNKIDNLDTEAGVKVLRINPDSVDFIDASGNEKSVKADSVLIAAGMQANTDEAEAFGMVNGRMYIVGDNKKAGSVMDLMRDAFYTAQAI